MLEEAKKNVRDRLNSISPTVLPAQYYNIPTISLSFVTLAHCDYLDEIKLWLLESFTHRSGGARSHGASLALMTAWILLFCGNQVLGGSSQPNNKSAREEVQGWELIPSGKTGTGFRA